MDAADQYALAIDLGTGGPKVGLVSLTGRLEWFEHLRVETRGTDDGAAEQDAEEWWQLITAAARRGVASGAVAPEQIGVVAVTGQWASRVAVDEAGAPVAPCVMWSDTRGRAHSKALIGGPVAGMHPTRALRWVRRSGGGPSPNGADPISHVLHLQRDRPELAHTRWYLEPVDYLTMRFTGRASASPASMLAAWLTDNRDLSATPSYDAALVKLAGVDPAKLPPLEPTGAVVGTVKPDLAADIGLAAGVKVVTGIPDLHGATVGSGAIGLYEPHLSISTTGWIGCPLPKKKTDVLHSMASVPGIGDGLYVLANSIDSAGVCLDWARSRILGPSASFDELFALADESRPGAGGALFTPWLGGTRSPVEDRGARGGWHNLALQTTRGDMLRAVLEGVAAHSRWLHETCEKFAGRRLDPIRLIGGGGQADLWAQIHADMLDRTIERVADPASAILRGAALFAGLSLDAIRPGDVRDLVAVDRTFTPDPGTRSVYDRIYAEMPKLHKRQRGLSTRLRG